MDAKMKVMDTAVAAVADSLRWTWNPERWQMASPTYKHPQADYDVETSPGAREFHLTDERGNRDGTSIRVHHFWNGSASFHPEQPTEYPGVTVRVAIPAGRYDIQRKLAERFREAIDEIMKEA